MFYLIDFNFKGKNMRFVANRLYLTDKLYLTDIFSEKHSFDFKKIQNLNIKVVCL